jgi:hypothetical protein
MELATNSRGNLTVAEPVVLYWLLATVMAFAAMLLAGWMWAEPGAIDGQPGWFRPLALSLSALASLGIAAWARFGKPIEFDRRRQAVVRGQRVVAPYAEIIHVELREVSTENNRTSYRVLLARKGKGALRIDLGPIPNDLDASTAAAKIATAIDRPVQLVRV